MATRREIKCINKSDRLNAHERITHIGNSSIPWKLTVEKAIAAIENNEYEFFVTQGGKTVDVIISTSALGHKYLKTKNDGTQPDNLLSLPECS